MTQELLATESSEKQIDKASYQTSSSIQIDWNEYQSPTKGHSDVMDQFPSDKELLEGFGDDGKGKNRTSGTEGKAERERSGSQEKPEQMEPAQETHDYGDPNTEHPFTADYIAKEGVQGIDQLRHGDCVFEASLAAVAGTPEGQQTISDSITRDGDNFVVTFPGDRDNPITVTKADLEKYGSENSATWAQIMETALVKEHPDLAQADYPATLPNGEKATPAQQALYLLTGEEASKSDADSDEEIGRKVNEALNNGQPVVAFCADDANGLLVSGHEWTVTGYDPNTNEITVRNPWGDQGKYQDPQGMEGMQQLPEGAVKMPLDTFQKYFKEVTWTGEPKESEESAFSWVPDALDWVNERLPWN